MIDFKLTVAICTYNPRLDYLTRVLESLSHQTLDKQIWELLLIDNNSKNGVPKSIDLSKHPHARYVFEERQGLTAARNRATSESSSPVIVLVDDDNVLDFDYLERVLEISEKMPFLGAWCGSVSGEYEGSLPPIPWLPEMLAVRSCHANCWGHIFRVSEIVPYGAGMCVRREVAAAYRQKCENDRKRAGLDRDGSSLLSGGDVDISYTALDLGLAIGRFSDMRLLHLISRERLLIKYLSKLIRGTAISNALLNNIRPETRSLVVWPSWLGLVKSLIKECRGGIGACRLRWAYWSGSRMGYKLVHKE